jgi:hypothetical protein
MSEYYLADRMKNERAKQREHELELKQQQAKTPEMKATLLGDFLFPTHEPAGADPYNSTQGKAAFDAWSSKREPR